MQTVAIVAAATHSLGHASVARALTEYLLRSGASIRAITVYSDQVRALERMRFFDSRVSLEALGRPFQSRYDLLILDSIPFRRSDALFSLLYAKRSRLPMTIIGHTGWVPYVSHRHLIEWRAALAFLRHPPVLLYHSEDVCQGNCHLSRLAPHLGVRVHHSGLLLPQGLPDPARARRRFCALSGGGAESRALQAAARALLRQLANWKCDFYVGPYSNIDPDSEHMTLLEGHSDVRERLATYRFSISRAGYSSICEHIGSKTPVILIPLNNPEQRANAEWAAPYLAQVSVNGDRYPPVLSRPPRRNSPKAFFWPF